MKCDGLTKSDNVNYKCNKEAILTEHTIDSDTLWYSCVEHAGVLDKIPDNGFENWILDSLLSDSTTSIIMTDLL